MRCLFVTGSRGEWGYIRPLMKLMNETEGVSFEVCATNMHLLPAFGHSVDEIEASGFAVDHKVYMSLDGYNHVTQVKSLSVFLASLADILARNPPDWIILAGDRGEQLMGAIAGAFCYVPVAHIQAGELSGNIDGMTRHAIGKYAHLHLAANQDAADRLVRLGEDPARVHNVGAPQIDELVAGIVTHPDEMESKYGLDLTKPYLLVVQHPVTEDMGSAYDDVKTTMSALREFEIPKVVILPNNDAGSEAIRQGIHEGRHGDFRVFANLPREDYLAFLKNASCLVGNSSSGILEAPTFGVPAVNIGRRQTGRVQGMNVLNTSFDQDAIASAIRKGLSVEFRRLLDTECENPYGDGRSSERILRILSQTAIDDRLLVKHLTY